LNNPAFYTAYNRFYEKVRSVVVRMTDGSPTVEKSEQALRAALLSSLEFYGRRLEAWEEEIRTTRLLVQRMAKKACSDVAFNRTIARNELLELAYAPQEPEASGHQPVAKARRKSTTKSKTESPPSAAPAADEPKGKAAAEVKEPEPKERSRKSSGRTRGSSPSVARGRERERDRDLREKLDTRRKRSGARKRSRSRSDRRSRKESRGSRGSGSKSTAHKSRESKRSRRERERKDDDALDFEKDEDDITYGRNETVKQKAKKAGVRPDKFREDWAPRQAKGEQAKERLKEHEEKEVLRSLNLVIPQELWKKKKAGKTKAKQPSAQVIPIPREEWQKWPGGYEVDVDVELSLVVEEDEEF
jgi:hypothetical protein